VDTRYLDVKYFNFPTAVLHTSLKTVNRAVKYVFSVALSCILHYVSICLMDRFIVRYLLPCSTSTESDSNWPGNKETENVLMNDYFCFDTFWV